MNQTQNLVFKYQENEIHFTHGENNVMVNATEMAKVFKKRIDFFLKTDHAKAFMEVLEFTPYGGNSEPLKRHEIIQTNHRHGTYLHRILALKFAAWLSPEFEVWVYASIEQILYGHYKEQAESIKETAHIDVEIEKLEKTLTETEEYLKIEELKLKKKQLAYRRTKANKNQMSLYKELYREDHE